MKFPFVSRGRFEDAQAEIARLRQRERDLLDAVIKGSELVSAIRAENAQSPEVEEIEPARPHRRLGSQISKLATDWATEKAGLKSKLTKVKG